jgi:predicted phage tail protein
LSDALANLSERQLWFGVAKFVLTITGALLLASFAVTVLVAKGGTVSTVTINALLISVAVSMLANGLVALLKAVDWFEARRGKRNG